jgi:hypothetical protein
MRTRVRLAAAASVLLAGCSGVSPATMVIDGRVDLGPLCPVERVDSPCPVPPGAFAGVEAVATSGGQEVRASVGGDGHFTITLTQGSWELTATAGMSCTPVPVSAPGRVVITCDTGIR